MKQAWKVSNGIIVMVNDGDVIRGFDPSQPFVQFELCDQNSSFFLLFFNTLSLTGSWGGCYQLHSAKAEYAPDCISSSMQSPHVSIWGFGKSRATSKFIITIFLEFVSKYSPSVFKDWDLMYEHRAGTGTLSWAVYHSLSVALAVGFGNKCQSIHEWSFVIKMKLAPEVPANGVNKAHIKSWRPD